MVPQLIDSVVVMLFLGTNLNTSESFLVKAVSRKKIQTLATMTEYLLKVANHFSSNNTHLCFQTLLWITHK